jgi:hypothetical protein
LNKNAPELVDAPVFVASDHQRPELEAAFAKAGAVFYRGKCHSYDKQCMVIDAEIATRSAYFYGLGLSTASQNIEHFRRQRDNGSPFEQLEAFPRFNFTTAPKANEWTPRRWQGGDSPESYFASRPKEDMDQVAVIPDSSEDTSENMNALGARGGGGRRDSSGGGGRDSVSLSNSVAIATAARKRICIHKVRARLTPVLWLVLVLALAFPRVQLSARRLMTRLGMRSLKVQDGDKGSRDSVLPAVVKSVSVLETSRRRHVFKQLEVESEPSSKCD